jgi:PAS domain S-box-containing protein
MTPIRVSATPPARFDRATQQCLLDLLLAVGHALDVTELAANFLPGWLSTLHCDAVAVFEADSVFYQEYKLLLALPPHDELLRLVEQLQTNHHFALDRAYPQPDAIVYVFELVDFGFLVCRHPGLSPQLLQALPLVTQRFSYALCACRRHQKLQRSERELDKFFALSDNYMCIIHPNGYLVKVNPPFLRQLGYDLDELYSTVLVDFIHPDEQPMVREHLQQLAREGTTDTVQCRVRHKQGHYVYLSWGFACELPVQVIYATAIDITQQIELERRLLDAKESAEQTAQAKAAFLANMSHEIRTPLNGVLGMLALIGQQSQDERLHKQIEIANQSGQSLLAIVNDVLDFSKINAGKLTLEALDFDLTVLLQDVVESFQYLAQRKNLILQLDSSGIEQRWLNGDALRLGQVMNNLLSNALKFTEHGHVMVLARSSQSDNGVIVTLEVSDTGIGLTAAQQQDIFQAFAQADVTTTRRFGGTGLGLSICKALCSLMHGDISVSSLYGKGTVFTVSVRLRSGQPVAVSRPAQPQQSAGLAGYRCLLVEDNPVNQEIAATMLRSCGCEVTTANDGRIAISILQQATAGQFDFIVMDCLMPNMDGYEATRQIRAGLCGAHWQQTPVLALTANAMPEDRNRCLQAGMSDYLAKPFQRGSLLHKIQTLLQRTEPDAGTAATTAMLAGSTPASDIALWQPAVFHHHFAGISPDDELEIMRLFVSQLDKQQQSLQQALATSDLATIRLCAHSLKSSAAQVGCVPLSQQAARVEAMLKQTVPIDPQQFCLLQSMMQQTQACLRQELADE